MTTQTIAQLQEFLSPPAKAKPFHYFAIVIRVPRESAVRDLNAGTPNPVAASTSLGNSLRNLEGAILPAGAHITRSIEITEDFATRAW